MAPLVEPNEETGAPLSDDASRTGGTRQFLVAIFQMPEIGRRNRAAVLSFM